MKKRSTYGATIVTLALIAVFMTANSGAAQEVTTASTTAAQAASIPHRESSFLSDHLQVGTRITGYILLHNTSDSFIGSINKLDASQDYMPVNFYADWFFTRYFGLDVTWDRFEAETVTDDKTDAPGHSDGTFKLKGPIVSVIGRYPNSTAFIPYGGAGVAFMSASFDEPTWWYTGFPSESDWENNGSPPDTLNGLNRIIDPKNAVGYVVFGGCDYEITANLLVDAFVRYMNVKVDAHYYLTMGGTDFDDRGSYSIPLQNVAMGIGISYLF